VKIVKLKWEEKRDMKKLSDSQKIWNKQLEERYKEDKQKIKKAKENEAKEVEVKKVKGIEIKNIKKNEKFKMKGLNNKEIEFKKLKKQFFEIDTDETIKKWKILSRAYKLGKQMYSNYSVLKLSKDFDIPYTTAKRVLSLDKANEKTWNLINNNKISAFKVAQICMTKNNKYQDEIVKVVIRNNLSTNLIKKLRIDKRGDIKEARLTAALEKGFSRKDVAYRSLKDTLLRLNALLTIKKEELPESKIIGLINLMESVKDKLQERINEFTDLDVYLNDRDEEEDDA